MEIRAIRKGFKIRILIRTIRKKFEAFYWKFEPFERNSKHSNVNSNHSKEIRSILNLQPFERDSKHSNAHSNHSKNIRSIRMSNSNHSKGIQSIQIQIWTIRKPKHSNSNSNIRKLECTFHSKEIQLRNSNHSKQINLFQRDSIHIRTIRKIFEAFEWDSKHSNVILNRKGFAFEELFVKIRSIRIQIQTISIRMHIKTIRKRFEPFKCKF